MQKIRDSLRSLIKLESLLCSVLFIYFANAIIKKSTIGLSMAGLPVSDASGWSACSKALGFFGVWPESDQRWCFRRPLYPAVNGIIFRILRSSELVMLTWSAIFCVLLYFLLREIKNTLGLIPASIVGILLGNLWLKYAATQVMSEQLGLTLGVFTAYLFLRYYVTKEFNSALLMVSVYSTSQVARPGNLVLIFVLVVFSFLTSKVFNIARFLFLSLSALLPFLIVKIFAQLHNLKNFMSSENSWATLYGLSKDNSSWNTAYTDFRMSSLNEEGFWRSVKDASVRNILADPIEFIFRIIQNSLQVVARVPSRISSTLSNNYLDAIFAVASSFALLFILLWVVRKRDLRIMMTTFFLCLILVVELFTYGIVLKSDAYRTMSTSFPLILVTILILLWLPFRYRKVQQSNYESFSNLRSISIILIMPLTVAISFGLATSTIMTNEKPVGIKSCYKQGGEVLLSSKSNFVQTKDVPTSSKIYWWQTPISDLPIGILVEGIFLSSQNSIFHKNLYFQGLDESIFEQELLCIDFNLNFSKQLEVISFSAATVLAIKP